MRPASSLGPGSTTFSLFFFSLPGFLPFIPY
jgi:hypothetical protein